MVLTADKGVAMVVMEKQDYTEQRPFPYLQTLVPVGSSTRTPTTRLKNKLTNTLRDIKQTGGLSDSSYRKVYPSSVVPPKFYALPKIHKVDTSIRPIVSSRGSITYGVAKELANIIHPFVGQSQHHLKCTQHFVQHI